MKVLYHSIFLPNPWGHGGEKRSCQLQEMHKAAGLELIPLRLKPEQRLSLRCLFLTTILLLNVYGLKGWKSLYVFARRVKHISLVYDQLIAFFSNQETNIFYWESTGEFWYFLPYLAHKYGKQIIAFPHNLESLVHGKPSSFFSWTDEERMHRELRMLRDCKDVYTISHEEAWFLQLMKINAHYLPYQLPKDVKNRCAQIKEKRKSSSKDYFLMLGSAINPPTRLGMEAVINCWDTEQTLIVAGFGTEDIKNNSNNDNIKILGTVSEEQLLELQIHCKALIINQPPTTGALTRVEEFLQAGIHIIANTDAVLSYIGEAGIYRYEDLKQLKSIVIGK